jgi:hypothetical protein
MVEGHDPREDDRITRLRQETAWLRQDHAELRRGMHERYIQMLER